MSKGSKRRPRSPSVPRWLYDARYNLATGHITKEQYDKIIKEHENEQKEKS